jgi:zinc protease
MKKGAATETELVTAKGMIITTDDLSRQTDASQATDAAIGQMYGLGYDFEQKFLEKVKAVTLDDVKRVANKYLNNYVLTITTPDEKAVEGLTPAPKIVK